MMCAVVSCPFWAGWLIKITAHTPASVPITLRTIQFNTGTGQEEGLAPAFTGILVAAGASPSSCAVLFFLLSCKFYSSWSVVSSIFPA
jgi:hypothetical protein